MHNNLSLYFLVSMPRSSNEESSFIRSVLDRSKRESVQVLTLDLIFAPDLALTHDMTQPPS